LVLRRRFVDRVQGQAGLEDEPFAGSLTCGEPAAGGLGSFAHAEQSVAGPRAAATRCSPCLAVSFSAKDRAAGHLQLGEVVATAELLLLIFRARPIRPGLRSTRANAPSGR
jgi:hypothetical protein